MHPSNFYHSETRSTSIRLKLFPGVSSSSIKKDKAIRRIAHGVHLGIDKLRNIWEAKWKSRRSETEPSDKSIALVIVREIDGNARVIYYCNSDRETRWLRNCAFALISDLHTHTIGINSLFQHPQSCYLNTRYACSGSGSVSSLSSRRQFPSRRSVKRTETRQMPL